MRRGHFVIAALAAIGMTSSGCSSDQEGCQSDNDCKGDRLCEQGECRSPASSGGTSSGGTGGTGAAATGGQSTGGVAGCPSECKTPAGTCCLGPNVCNIVVPCAGNPCCE